MHIHVSPADGGPLYAQIVNQVTYLVASGRLLPEEELPPIRVLAEKLVINPNTVARAYRELELAGIVTKRGTTGTYVSAHRKQLTGADRLALLTERVDGLVTEARQLDVPIDDLLDLTRRRYSIVEEDSAQPATPNF